MDAPPAYNEIDPTKDKPGGNGAGTAGTRKGREDATAIHATLQGMGATPGFAK